LLSDPFDRRRFLAGAARGAAALAWAGAGVGGVVACAVRAAGTSAAGTSAAAIPAPSVETLHSPIVLQKGEVLADRRFELAPDFAWTSSMAAIYVAAPDVTIRNVELVGALTWLPRWNVYNEPRGAPPGINSGTCAIRLQRAPRARIEGVRIAGFPRSAIEGFGLDDAVIRDVKITRCFTGIKTDYYAPNPRLRIEGVEVRDLWGPGPNRWPGVGGAPSRLRPGGFMGSDGMALHSLRDAVVRDSAVLGEQFASFKLVNPQSTVVSGLRGIQLMLQGTSDLAWKIDKEPSRNTVVRSCTLDKSLGSGALAETGNGMQISWHVKDLTIENCTLIAAGQGGHGIQFAVDVHGRITGCTFDGFNGKAGVTPSCALQLVDGSTVNEDFAQVNTFVNQDRILLRQ
jgi:hypothetical protein